MAGLDHRIVSASNPRQRRLGLWAFAIAGALALTAGMGANVWMRARGLTLAEAVNELQRGDEPRFEWRSIDRKHWQASVVAIESAATGDAGLEIAPSAGCPDGMIRVKGAYRAGQGQGSAEVERLQDSACIEWINKDFPARCAAFDPEKIARGLGEIQTRPVDVCIDRFEYPNVAGQNPIIVVTFREAEALCKSASKRLCTEDEWTFACEGEEARPYPYGFTRDAAACVVDRSWRPFTEGALFPRDGRLAREELDRLWQGEPSGSRPDCKSPFGVYDLTGNVDEWTRSTRSSGLSSILKGGYWGPVRARCRPSTRVHNEDFVAYQQGFRCCAAPESTESPTALDVDAGAAEPPPEDEDESADRTPILLESDELDGLARTRAAFRCDVVRAPAPGSRGTVLALAWVALAYVSRLRTRTRS